MYWQKYIIIFLFTDNGIKTQNISSNICVLQTESNIWSHDLLLSVKATTIIKSIDINKT